jgi:hypothetical protein
MQGPAPIMGENDVDDERSVESYNMLMEVLQASNIEDDEEVRFSRVFVFVLPRGLGVDHRTRGGVFSVYLNAMWVDGCRR